MTPARSPAGPWARLGWSVTRPTPCAARSRGFRSATNSRVWWSGLTRAGATFGAAFGALLKQLLPSYGLLHVDPMLPAIRELAAPTIRAALEHAPELTAALLERNQELTAAGYHAQVHVEDHTSLVFLLEGGRRIALKRKGGEYAANGKRFSTDELMDRAATLSPNALLRPVVQDTILPTVAYIGGPAELAYLAQSEVIYSRVLGRMPVAVPRSGFTLFDQRSAKLMQRYDLRLADFFPGDEHLRERIASTLVPPPIGAGDGGDENRRPTLRLTASRRRAGRLRSDAGRGHAKQPQEDRPSALENGAQDPAGDAAAGRKGLARRGVSLRSHLSAQASAGAALFHRAVPGQARC